MPEPILDRWAAWLLDRRHGGDPEALRRTLDRLAIVRDRVLDNAGIGPGETLLDVGTGDGLIAFGALGRVSEHGSVVFSDVSEDLLAEARVLAAAAGVLDRCRFVPAAAEHLAPIANASIDAVTTRSVLAYVAAKRDAFAEFARVLRPGGRVSLYEPVNRHLHPGPPDAFDGYDVSPVQDVADKLRVYFDERQPPDTDPMLDFDERDLLAFAARAGFGERHLELRIDVRPQAPRPWETYARSAPNPLAPTLHEAIADALTPAEANRFVAHLRPLVERGEGTFTVAVAYLWGVKG
ncbi:MAG: methyltransferase domain-containing protein [Chloroflexota bacterium]|nr:methyltransferase domain-containing protein [Chloroflexota bacterium]